MKRVFKDYDELAHVWAQQNQPAGETSGKFNGRPRMFFRDSKVFSYGEHFCIARFLPTGTVLFTYRDYSSTTTTQKFAVRSAVRGRPLVFCRDPSETSARLERERIVHQIAELLQEAQTKPRIRQVTRDKLRLSALNWANQFNTYLAAIQEAYPQDVAPIDVSNLEGVTEELRKEIAEAQARKVQREEERKALERENLVKWRAHDPDMAYANFYGIADALRLSKDGTEVETSRGANIPVSHAKRLWPLIENCRSVGKPLENRDVHLGHYTLHRIDANGDIIVGCHSIAYSEIETIARQLGLIHEGEPA